MFLDYGNIVSIPEKDLRVMEPRYLHLPFQVRLQCYVINITYLLYFYLVFQTFPTSYVMFKNERERTYIKLHFDIS